MDARLTRVSGQLDFEVGDNDAVGGNDDLDFSAPSAVRGVDMRRPGSIAIVVFALCSAPAAGQAPQPLTGLDYIEIQQLVSKYARAIDTCSNNGYDYADLFTADGYFAPEQGGNI